MATKSLQRMNLDPGITRKLLNRRFSTAKDVLVATEFELVEALDVSYQHVEQLALHVSSNVAPRPTTVLELQNQASHQLTHLPTHLQPLDDVLRGGVPVAGITEVVGPAGVGKSQLCHMLTVAASVAHLDMGQAGSVMYIDTEKKFSSKRVVELAKTRWPHHFASQEAVHQLSERILVVNPDTSEALVKHIKALEASIIDYGIKLILIDSIAVLARSEFSIDKIVDRQQVLGQLASMLKHLAETFKIPVVVVNQVTAQVYGAAQHAFQAPTTSGPPVRAAEGHLTAALGTMWAHAVNTRLVLETSAGVRYIKVAKSPEAPMAAFAYTISAAGLELIDGHNVPEQAQSSVINMHIAHDMDFEPQAMVS